jgi:hypothetical protein
MPGCFFSYAATALSTSFDVAVVPPGAYPSCHHSSGPW